jgi:outer membrane protein
MNTLKKSLIALFVLLTIQTSAQSKERNLRLTLEECITFAIENSLNQQSLKLDRNASEINYRQSRQERLPQVYGTASQNLTNYNTAPVVGNNPSWTGSYGINASVNLWSGGLINHNIEQSRLLFELSDHQIKQSENFLTINVIQAFLSVIGYEELLRYQHEALQLSETQVRMGRTRLNAGQILESDFMLLEAQFASDKFSIVNSENARNNSLLALRNLLSLSPEQSLEIIAPNHEDITNMSVLPTLNRVIELSLGNMPELRISKQNISLAENNIKIAQAGYSPRLTLNAGLGTGYTSGYGGFGNELSNRFNQNISLNLNIPIYSNGRNRNNVQRSRIQVEQANLRHNQNELDIMQQVEREYQNIVTGLQRYDVAKIQRNATSANFNAYEKQFEAGVVTVTDLLLQKNNYIGAFNEYVQSKYSYILERKILDIYMGVN